MIKASYFSPNEPIAKVYGQVYGQIVFAATHCLAKHLKTPASFELNIEVNDITLVLPDYRYTTPPYNGIIENEFCPVYFAKIPNNNLKLAANTSEVESYKWVSILDLRTAIAKEPDTYSYWIKDQLLQLEKVLP